MTVDPLADKYPGWSPYNYCGSNPVVNFDPNGMDWYKSGDAVIWQDSKESSICLDDQEYQNIGETYSYTAGNETYVYEQNTLVSLVSTVMVESQWRTQFDGSAKQKTRCYITCTEMLSATGNQTAGRGNEVLMTSLGGNGTAGGPSSNAQLGIGVIQSTLTNGAPIIVGVDYKPGSPNADGMTDHFVVIMAVEYNLKNNTTSYRFFDPGTIDDAVGTSSKNLLYESNNQLKGIFSRNNKNYTVTSVRRNQ